MKSHLYTFLVIYVLFVGAAVNCNAFADVKQGTIKVLKTSQTLQDAHRAYRDARISAGLHPDLIPHITYIKMRDGVKLFTLWWDPRIGDEKVPTVIVRSPYSPFGTENMATLYFPFGYSVVEQNERGTGASGGSFCFWMDSTTDGTDTNNWILNQTWSNGQLFQIGASADGILTLVDTKHPQPAMGAQWLMITSGLAYKTMYQNSQATRWGLSKVWLDIIQATRPEFPKDLCLNVSLRNVGFDTANEIPKIMKCDSKLEWQKITLNSTNIKDNVHFPQVWWGGWYDIFLSPMIETFKLYEQSGQESKFVIGPRGHCFFEDTVSFPDDRLAPIWAYTLSLSLFDQNRKDKNEISSHFMRPLDNWGKYKRWTLYVMGPQKKFLDDSDYFGMYFTSIDTWPQPTSMIFYPNSQMQLSKDIPLDDELTYTYDPENFTPTRGGNNLFLECGPQLQNDIEGRADNLVFTSEAFSDNVAILGSAIMNLTVKTNRNDTDFVVRITDVYPNGQSMLLGDNIVRMRWRGGDVVETKTVPGQVYDIQIVLWETCYVFNKGHKVRIAVTSSNFERYSLNRNNGLLDWQTGPTLVAQNTILLGATTSLELPVVPVSSLPKFSIL